MSNILSIGNPKRATVAYEIKELLAKHPDLRLEDILGILETLKMDYWYESSIG